MPPSIDLPIIAGLTDGTTAGGAPFSNGLISPFDSSSVPFPTANLIGWYKADAGVTKTGTAITGWADQSGNHNDLTGTATYVAYGLNGLPTISFNGTSDALTIASFNIGTQNLSMFVVYKLRGGGGNYPGIITYGGAAGIQASLIFAGGLSQLGYYRDNSAGSPFPDIGYNNWSETTLIFRSDNTEGMWLNGASTNYSSNLGGALTSPAELEIGSRSGGSTFSAIDVAEIIIFNTAKDTDRAAIETYLNTKWLAQPIDTTNMFAWYCGDNGIASGLSTVDKWADKSGNLNHLTATSTAKPTYTTNALNGLPVLTFDGVANTMSGTMLFSSPTGVTMIMVLNTLAGSAFGVYASINAGDHALYEDPAGYGAPSHTTYATNNGTFQCIVANLGATPTGYKRLVATDDAANKLIQYFVNNVSTGAPVTTAGTNITSGQTLALGVNTVQYMNMAVAEAIFFKAPLNTTQLTAIDNYLKAKYGLT